MLGSDIIPLNVRCPFPAKPYLSKLTTDCSGIVNSTHVSTILLLVRQILNSKRENNCLEIAMSGNTMSQDLEIDGICPSEWQIDNTAAQFLVLCFGSVSSQSGFADLSEDLSLGARALRRHKEI